MSLMQVKNGFDTIHLDVPDAVRISHDDVQRMAQEIVNDIRKDTRRLYKLYDGATETYSRATGDVLVIGMVEATGMTLLVEISVCKIERRGIFEI